MLFCWAPSLPTWRQLAGAKLSFRSVVLALCLLAAGCGGAGSNGGSGDDGGDGPSAPPAPSGLSAAPESSAVQLEWGAASGADSYRVYRSTTSGAGASGSPLEMGIPSTEYADETAENGTEYFYAVTAVASGGEETAESDPSSEASALPFAPPSGLEGTSEDSKVSLSWQEASGADTYNVYRNTTSTSGAEGEPLAEDISDAAYVDTTAENGTKYYYRVTSVNANGAESTASSEVAKTPFAPPPGQP